MVNLVGGLYQLQGHLAITIARCSYIYREGEYPTLYCPIKTHCIMMIMQRSSSLKGVNLLQSAEKQTPFNTKDTRTVHGQANRD